LRRLHNEELHRLYDSPNAVRVTKSWRKRWTGYVTCTGEMINSYIILVEKPEGKRPLGRPRHRWDDNIRTDLLKQGAGWKGVKWTNLIHSRDQWGLL